MYINGWLVAVGVPATQYRQDVANALGISGYNAFGFYLPIPKSFKIGSSMQIAVKYSGTQTNIPGSPKTTAACQASTNPFGCSGTGAGRMAQAESTTYSRTDGLSLKLSRGGSGTSSSLTSKLIPVRKGDQILLDAYAYAPVQLKPNLTPQLTTAVVGGLMGAVALTQHKAGTPDQLQRSIPTVPTLGVSTALMVPLVKSLLSKRLPDAHVDVAFYNRHGRFVHRQQVSITRAARMDWQQLHIESYAQEAGYIAVRLQNRSNTPVWFDDVSVQTVQQREVDSVNKELFVPEIRTSTNGLASQQSINSESVYRNCMAKPVASDDGIWLPEVTVHAGNWLPEVTVVGQANDISPDWGWLTDSGSDIYSGGNGNYDAPGFSNEGSSSTFIPGGAPEKPEVGAIYTASTGTKYMYDGKSWCIILDPVDVKGNRPTNPKDGEIYKYTDPQFGYTIVYEFINGTWTMPVEKQSISFIKPEKQELNSCNDKVYDRLVNSNGVLRSTILTILKKFDISQDLTIIFSDGNIGPANLDGVTTQENSTTYHIELNETALANASQEYIAATIIHEVLHV